MTDSPPLNLYVQVEMADADADELDQLTRQLLREIEETHVESAQLARSGNLPEGAKGEPITIGAILVTVLPAVLPKLVETVGAWAQRGNGRTVKYKGQIGENSFEFEGSSEDLQALLKSMTKTRKVSKASKA